MCKFPYWDFLVHQQFSNTNHWSVFTNCLQFPDETDYDLWFDPFFNVDHLGKINPNNSLKSIKVLAANLTIRIIPQF